MPTPCSVSCRNSEQDTDSYRNLEPKYQSSDSKTWFVQMQMRCRHWYPMQEVGAGALQWVLSQCWGRRAPAPFPLSPGISQSCCWLQSSCWSSADRGAAALHSCPREDNEMDIWQEWKGQLLLICDVPFGTTIVHTMPQTSFNTHLN